MFQLRKWRDSEAPTHVVEELLAEDGSWEKGSISLKAVVPGRWIMLQWMWFQTHAYMGSTIRHGGLFF